MTKQTVAKQVKSVIVNASITQAERNKAWQSVAAVVLKQGESVVRAVVRAVKAAGLTVFTLADAKAFSQAASDKARAAYPEGTKISAAMKTKIDKAGRNAVMYLRRTLVASGITCEKSKRGGANNPKGTNNNPKAKSKGLPKIIEAIALVRQAADSDLFEKDHPMFIHLLAIVETNEKAKLTAIKK